MFFFLIFGSHLAEDFADIPCDCGCGGKTGRFDSGDVDKAFVRLALGNDEIAVVACDMGTKTGKGGDSVSCRQLRNDVPDVGLHLVKSLDCCIDVKLRVKVKVNRRRSHQHVAVSGRGNENTFTHGGRTVE